MTQAEFKFRRGNPDVLTSIANLSNDEVFTPPEFANKMLDTLEEAWAASNNGANIWEDSTVTFLDPFTKSGVFLREITERLTHGLEKQIPDLQERVNHILTKQVFGIAITQLTSLLARRSVYCSKWANGEHSIVTAFDNPDGNIWFERTEHTWVGGKDRVIVVDENGDEVSRTTDGKCKFCGANQKDYARDNSLESHAYPLIHSENIQNRINELFGVGMKFDVIIGNPPYQLSDGGHGSSAAPIYQYFVDKAIELDPNYLSLVIPARWYSGGKGLEEFRQKFLGSRQVSQLHDFPSTNDVFPGVNVRGGICYFLWQKNHNDDVKVVNYDEGKPYSIASRPLIEPGATTFVRYNIGVDILRKVLAVDGSKLGGLESPFSALVSSRKPYGLDTTFRGHEQSSANDLFVYRNGGSCFARPSEIKTGHESIENIKIFIPYASPGSDEYPHLVLSKPIVAGPMEICTETYLQIGPFENEFEAKNVASYMATKFFRFMVSLMRSSQHITKNVYSLAPLQDFEKRWTDELLYEKYDLSEEEITFIDSVVKAVAWEHDYL